MKGVAEMRPGQEKTAIGVTPREMEVYRRAARARWQAKQRQAAKRRERAWVLARQAAALLKTQYGAKRVIVFGSLVHDRCFTRWSDVDLAVAGMTWPTYLHAWSAVEGLSKEIAVDLVEIETASDRLRRVIEREGVPL